LIGGPIESVDERKRLGNCIMQGAIEMRWPCNASGPGNARIIDPNPVSRTFTPGWSRLRPAKALPLWVLTSAYRDTHESSRKAEAAEGAFPPSYKDTDEKS
jgi:hypothetical protein